MRPSQEIKIPNAEMEPLKVLGCPTFGQHENRTSPPVPA